MNKLEQALNYYNNKDSNYRHIDSRPKMLKVWDLIRITYYRFRFDLRKILNGKK